MSVTEVKGTITTSDGQTREFSIVAGLGWSQWGNTTPKLGDTVEVIEAMTQAVAEHMESEE